MIERDLSYAGPLCGRATRVVKLRGFDYVTVRRIFPSVDERRIVEIYSILGGTPHYLLMYDHSKDLHENIVRLFLERGAPLYEEAERMLQTELREPIRYLEIMEAIAMGKLTLKEISDYRVIERTKLKKYILTLEKMDIIGKEPTIMKTRVPRYQLLDNFFSFYMRFINPMKDRIEFWSNRVCNSGYNEKLTNLLRACI
ncbi:MAG: ATP-binding protein [Aigarchaeota archaeon]|nr:ATP-binding protein [Candidatus Pelearchaeum maunauluense]